jgi:deoxyribose-phosphate aldolase
MNRSRGRHQKAMGNLASPVQLDSREGLARLIDHTLLKATATPKDVDRLCDEAVKYCFWSVCVNPIFVRHASERIGGSGTRVCAVVGFPLGANTTEVKLAEARAAVEDGASELDMVSNIGALKAGDEVAFSDDVREVASLCRRTNTLLKVILECCYLTDAEKARGAVLADRAGADFVKTSTGFGPGGASAADVSLLKRSLTSGKGVKAAGGIATLATALEMIRAGADRIGTSSGVAILEELPPPVTCERGFTARLLV